jgi:hypothetical protein
MKEMGVRHTAENIKIRIEEIVNEFDFDKSKIHAIVSDEGSNFLKLFKYQEEYLNSRTREEDSSESQNSDDEFADSEDEPEITSINSLNRIIEAESDEIRNLNLSLEELKLNSNFVTMQNAEIYDDNDDIYYNLSKGK